MLVRTSRAKQEDKFQEVGIDLVDLQVVEIQGIKRDRVQEDA